VVGPLGKEEKEDVNINITTTKHDGQ